MTQNELIKYFADEFQLRCKYWTDKEIKEYIKETCGKSQRVYKSTIFYIKRTAEMYQR